MAIAVATWISLLWVPAVAQQAGDSAIPDARHLQLAAGGAPDKPLMPPPRSPRRGLLVPPGRVRVKPALPASAAKALGLETKPLPAPREPVMAAPMEPMPARPAETGPVEISSAAPDPLGATTPESATVPEVVTAPEAAVVPAAEAVPPSPSTPQAAEPQAPAPQIESVDPMPEAPAAEATPTPAPQTAALPPLEGVRLLFTEGTADLSDRVKRDLGRFAEALLGHDRQRIQLLAYAKGTADAASQARRLSLTRALAVRSYLMAQGVLPTRMDVRALGNKADNDPRDRVDVELARR